MHLPMNREELRIRPMCLSDVETVSALEAQVFSMPWSRNAFTAQLADANSLYLVAEMDGVLAGYCGVVNILGEGDIYNVAVREELRGKGIAYAMLTELIAEGEAMGIESFTLEVRSGNAPAIHVYEKLGFSSVGIRPNFYEKPREDAMIMWRRQQTPTITT